MDPATAATAGTSRVFTETLLKNAIQGVWTQGGDPKVLMTGPFNKATVSGFSGIATRFRDVPAGAQAEIVGAADVYVSDFGTVNVVPNRFQPEYNAYLLDPEYASVAYLRNFRTEVLGLVKAQQVKNAVIVPVGSKGGFVPKHLPAGGSREAIQAEGTAATRITHGPSILEGSVLVRPNRVSAD